MASNISINNIYYMLAYAYHRLRESNFTSLSAENFDHIHDLFSAILIKGVSSQVKRGLFKDYIQLTETIPTIKGKINISESIKKQTRITSKIECSHDNFTEDNIQNQIIKTSMQLLYFKGNISPQNRISLFKLLVYFGEVKYISPSEINWKSLSYHRNNATYRLLINICWLLLQGLLQTTNTGEYKLSEFLDDQNMHRLYEKFILGYYQAEHPEYCARAAQIPWDLGENEDGMFLPTMQSDVTLTYGERTLIIDAKYYSKTMQKSWPSSKETYISNNLYQIYTYVKNYDREKKGLVSGILLYAKTDEITTPSRHFLIGNNKIGGMTLDLSLKWDNLIKILETIPIEFLLDK